MSTPLVLRAATAADLMTPGPVSLAASATAGEATHYLTSRGFGAAVVIDDAGHPVGVVTKTDLLVHARERARGLEPDDTPVEDVMTPAGFAVREDAPAGFGGRAVTRAERPPPVRGGRGRGRGRGH
ncbi:MAG TPA: CBS domain-containing protein [Gemmataceae bacterium]|nr:CBS domain-containing protein [Gemmataceae bacterium]